ncbi:hypothetical protein FNV43_RR00521 [Rhamnella rubrinervis]|uniref:ADP-ribosyl cyclase/cyclic ADP-ribose hydrolase n=1 Tax=Rhamnella rubrinervis TaxID=2594499 RepID=A0A8K0HQT7_9ROSA|nr:hypothetical protein FNV43_RR00521 [Rhamnella rubrinervis]
MDHRLKKGDEIAPTLEKTINESAISVIIIPIFYGIDPSIVRKQEGSYKAAFEELEERFKNGMEKVLQWKAALTQHLVFVGWIQRTSGKTTLASAVFQKFAHSHFEGRSYVQDVRQRYETEGPNKLRKELLTKLFNDENAQISMDTPLVGSQVIQVRLRLKKVLIVFDDVDSSVQLETLVEGYHELAPGSRVIVTSRNKQVLVKVANGICKLEGLNDVESLKLFHLHAFGRNSYPTEYYETLSERVASYANGNPLALKALGSSLHSRSEEEWESALEKLKRVPKKEILEVLKISYEGLEDKEIKNIFLDIACFFESPFNRDYAESILDGYSSAKGDMSTLVGKSLLEISHEENDFRMHDLIRQMGRSIVSDEHEKPINRSRLFHANDVSNVLQTDARCKMNSAAFSKMCNLRFLKIYCDNIDSKKFKLYLPRRLESLVSNKLRYFEWDFYPLESLPKDFSPENLVELILHCSHLKQLENHVVKICLFQFSVSLPKLKMMGLSYSKLLTRIADLSQAPNLESINLEGCTSLFHVLSSLQNLRKLAHLNLKGCNNLIELAEVSGRRGHLDIGGYHICYPGDEIPNVFTYRSTGSSMNINLPLNWNSNDSSGVAFCIVFGRSKADDKDVFIDVEFDGHACPGGGCRVRSTISLDHVLMWAVRRWVFKCNIEKYCNSGVTEVSFQTMGLGK